MARLKNTSGGAVTLFGPPGTPDAMRVEADQIIEVPGNVSVDADGYVVIGDGDNARAWPKATWQVTKPEENNPNATTGGGTTNTGTTTRKRAGGSDESGD